MGIFWRISDTVLLAIGIAYVYVKYGSPFFGNRRDAIESSLAKAKEYEKKAEEIYEEARINLAEAKKEIEDIKKEAIKEAEIEKNGIIENARASADKILDSYIKQAKSEIDNQKKRLFEDALNMSFKAASDILQKEMTAEAYNRINDNFLKLQEDAFAKQSNK
jgi:F-type H+-transporting ATPase subunit b